VWLGCAFTRQRVHFAYSCIRLIRVSASVRVVFSRWSTSPSITVGLLPHSGRSLIAVAGLLVLLSSLMVICEMCQMPRPVVVQR